MQISIFKIKIAIVLDYLYRNDHSKAIHTASQPTAISDDMVEYIESNSVKTKEGATAPGDKKVNTNRTQDYTIPPIIKHNIAYIKSDKIPVRRTPISVYLHRNIPII